jgi:hypothetical protein
MLKGGIMDLDYNELREEFERIKKRDGKRSRKKLTAISLEFKESAEDVAENSDIKKQKYWEYLMAKVT